MAAWNTTELGDGAFRRGFRINSTDLVIKFPQDYSKLAYDDGVKHTRAEYDKIVALSKFKCLKSHMPSVRYYDRENGVIVLKFYKKIAKWRMYSRIIQLLGDVVFELTGQELSDIMGDNVKGKDNGDLVFVDLGY